MQSRWSDVGIAYIGRRAVSSEVTRYAGMCWTVPWYGVRMTFVVVVNGRTERGTAMRLIDADAFSDFIKRVVFEHGYEVTRICDTLTAADVFHSVCAELDGTGLEGFKNAPTVDAVPVRHGRWRNGICDQCGGHAPFWAMATTYYQSNFCPNCGADMRKDGEAHD